MSVDEARSRRPLRSRGWVALTRIGMAAALTALLTTGLTAAEAAPLDSRTAALEASKAFQTAARVPVGWTGSVDSCTVGTESAASLQATLAAVNLLRDAAGVPPVTFDTGLNQRALTAALIMAGQQALSHTPDTSWRCYTEDGAATAGRSNLAIGFSSGPAAMLAYADDDGVYSLGHRRWLLDPAAAVFGSGSTGPLGTDRSATNALWVINGGPAATVPAGKRVAWPPAGHVPLDWIPDVWSLAIGAPGQIVDVTAARVQISLDGQALPDPAVATLAPGYGTGTTIAWTPTFDAASLLGETHTFAVSISGITVAGISTPVEYSVVVDNAPPGAPTAVGAALVGSGTAVDVSWTAPALNGGSTPTGYSVTASPGGATCSTTIWGVGGDDQPARRAAAPTSCRIYSLARGVDYTFTVVAQNEAGSGPVSAPPATASVPPATVTPIPPAIATPVPPAIATPVPPSSSTPVLTQPAPPVTQQPPATSTLPAVSVKVKATSKRSKLAVDVNPNKGKGYWSFQVQRSDNGNWTPLKTYRTSGAKEKRTVNLPKGTYRVVVLAKYGHGETTSGSAVLLK